MLTAPLITNPRSSVTQGRKNGLQVYFTTFVYPNGKVDRSIFMSEIAANAWCLAKHNAYKRSVG